MGLGSSWLELVKSCTEALGCFAVTVRFLGTSTTYGDSNDSDSLPYLQPIKMLRVTHSKSWRFTRLAASFSERAGSSAGRATDF